jgi:hypothetical protein
MPTMTWMVVCWWVVAEKEEPPLLLLLVLPPLALGDAVGCWLLGGGFDDDDDDLTRCDGAGRHECRLCDWMGVAPEALLARVWSGLSRRKTAERGAKGIAQHNNKGHSHYRSRASSWRRASERCDMHR